MYVQIYVIIFAVWCSMCPFTYLSIYVSLLCLYIYIHVSICLSLHMRVYWSKHLEEFPSSKQYLSRRKAIRGLCNLNKGVLTGIYQGEIQRSTKFRVFLVWFPPVSKQNTKLQTNFMMKKTTHKYLRPLPSKLAASLRTSSFLFVCCPIMFDTLVVILSIYAIYT